MCIHVDVHDETLEGIGIASGTDSGSDFDTEQEIESPSIPTKSRKLAIATMYRSYFKPVWVKKSPLITSVSGDYFR